MKTKSYCNTCKYYKQHYKYGDLIHTCFVKKSFYSEHDGNEDAKVKNKNNDCEDYEFHNLPYPKPDAVRYSHGRHFSDIRDALDDFGKELSLMKEYETNLHITYVKSLIELDSSIVRNEREVFCKYCRFCFIQENGNYSCSENPGTYSTFNSESVSYDNPKIKNFDNRCPEYKRQAIKPHRSCFNKLKIKLKYKFLRKL